MQRNNLGVLVEQVEQNVAVHHQVVLNTVQLQAVQHDAAAVQLG
jgi:hypothetical protein